MIDVERLGPNSRIAAWLTTRIGSMWVVYFTAAGDIVKRPLNSEPKLCSRSHGLWGPQDATGPAGPPGPAGANGVSGYELVFPDFVVPAGGFLRNTATCPAGKKVFGGGASVIGEFSQNFHTIIQETTPGTIGGGALDLWLVAIQNNDNAPHTVRISAVCGFAA